MTDAELFFDRDVARQDQDDLLTEMVDVAYGASSERIETISRDNVGGPESPNMLLCGVVTYKGREYYFEVEDGMYNGTKIIHWERN